MGSGLFLVTLLAVAFWSYADIWPAPNETPQSDAIICLGGGSSTQTGEIGPFSRLRALTCADLYLAGKAPVILFTGASGLGPDRSVAHLMADVAEARGVPRRAMILEPHARSTLQNALYALPLLGDAQSIHLVTDAFHLPRSWLSLTLVDAPEMIMVPSQSGSIRPTWHVLIREPAAIWFNLLRYPVYKAAHALGIDGAVNILH